MNAPALGRLITPQRAVFIGGASVVPAIEWCRRNAFAGQIAAVNPRRGELGGVPCVPSVLDLDDPPDVAFIVIPKESVVATIRDLRAVGAGGAVVHTSGFSEMDGGAGRTAELVDACGDMGVIGPNTPGFANFLDRACFMQDHFGSHDVERGVAFISNGGAYLSDVGLNQRSVPAAYLFGMGNQAVLDVVDVMAHVVEDERVTAINLYLEHLPNAARLAAVAARAHERGLPVVVVKGGRTPVGRQASQSHTASLAGDAEVASALFERLGFTQAHTASEALETLKALTMTRPIRGRRLGFATSSGSYAVLGGDVAHHHGCELPQPSGAAARTLEDLLPPFVHATNPLDISTDHGAPADHQRAVYDAFLDQPIDLAVQVMAFPPDDTGMPIDDWFTTTGAFAAAADARGVPCAFVATTAESLPSEARTQMIDMGMAPLMDLRDGFGALARAGWWRRRHEQITAARPASIALPDPHPAHPTHAHDFDEAAGKALLAAHGVAVPDSIVIEEGQGTTRLPGSGPWAVKALVAGLVHKTEAGALALDCADRAAVDAAIAHMRTTLGAERFLVERMVDDAVAELLVGVRNVADVGHVLTLAMGGPLVELRPDSATVVLPAPRSVIEDALRSLHAFPLLDGYRGRRPADLSGVLETISRIVDAALAERAVEVEVNPVLARPDGPAIAVDTVLSLEEAL